MILFLPGLKKRSGGRGPQASALGSHSTRHEEAWIGQGGGVAVRCAIQPPFLGFSGDVPARYATNHCEEPKNGIVMPMPMPYFQDTRTQECVLGGGAKVREGREDVGSASPRAPAQQLDVLLQRAQHLAPRARIELEAARTPAVEHVLEVIVLEDHHAPLALLCTRRQTVTAVAALVRKQSRNRGLRTLYCTTRVRLPSAIAACRAKANQSQAPGSAQEQ